MTPWELAACVDGYNLAHGAEPEPEPPSVEEFADMVSRHAKIVTLH